MTRVAFVAVVVGVVESTNQNEALGTRRDHQEDGNERKLMNDGDRWR